MAESDQNVEQRGTREPSIRTGVPLQERLYGWWIGLPERTQAWLRALAVLGLYTLITVVVTWPVAKHLSDGLPGVGGDELVKTWRFWHVKEALLRGQNPAHTSTLAYPEGHTSRLMAAMLVLPVAFLPVTLIGGPVLAYNLAFLLSFILTGYVGYLLCKDIAGEEIAALLGGLILMLMPLRVAQLFEGHVEFASFYLPLLYMLLLRRTLIELSARRAILAGVALALAALLQLTLPLYVLLPWTAIYVLVYLAKRAPSFWDWSHWRALLIAAGVTLVIVAVFFVPLAVLLADPPDYVEANNQIWFSADLLSLITLPLTQPILRRLDLIPVWAENILQTAPHEKTAYVGIVPLALALIGWRREVDEKRAWLLAAALAAVLALGPFLSVGGELMQVVSDRRVSYIALPYLLLEQIPVINAGRTPGRFNAIVGITLGVLAAQGGAALAGRLTRRVWLVVAALAGAFITVEYALMWPYVWRDVTPPAGVAALAETPPDGAIADVPVTLASAVTQGMFYQTQHRWPMITGKVARELPNRPGLLEMVNWITLPVSAGRDIIPQIEPEAAGMVLSETGVRYVLFHRNLNRKPEPYEAHLESLFGPPVAADDLTALYAVEPTGNAPALVYALHGAGWGDVETWFGEPARWLNGPAKVIIYASQDLAGTLRFRALAGDRARQMAIRVNDSEERIVEVGAYGMYALLDVRLQAGYNVIALDAPGGCWPVTGDAHCYVGSQSIAAIPPEAEMCEMSAEPVARCLGVLVQAIEFVP